MIRCTNIFELDVLSFTSKIISHSILFILTLPEAKKIVQNFSTLVLFFTNKALLSYIPQHIFLRTISFFFHASPKTICRCMLFDPIFLFSTKNFLILSFFDTYFRQVMTYFTARRTVMNILRHTARQSI